MLPISPSSSIVYHPPSAAEGGRSSGGFFFAFDPKATAYSSRRGDREGTRYFGIPPKISFLRLRRRPVRIPLIPCPKSRRHLFYCSRRRTRRGPNAISLLLADALYADGPLLGWLKYRKGIDVLVRLPEDRLLYQDVQGLADAQLIEWTLIATYARCKGTSTFVR